MMCPGLTSPGGSLPPADLALPAETAVAIFAEGKEHAAGMGILKMGTEEIRKVKCVGKLSSVIHRAGEAGGKARTCTRPPSLLSKDVCMYPR